ncbi:MAG: response regulator [Leptospiraceae bacterium]|nr:response regulator [Leptospiraceae bacterium]MCP5501176.1 response regulator [Leptospiraceae bacterium]
MIKILIVDDNDRYANHLKAYFEKFGLETHRALDARQGWEMFQQTEYHTLVSDITMESQTSGLFFVRKVYKSGFKGNIIIATTGFDVFGVMGLSKFFLPFFAGVGWMIPKVPLKQGIVKFFPTNLKKGVDFESLLQKK